MKTTIKSTIYLVEYSSTQRVADLQPLSKTAPDVTVISRIHSTTSKVTLMILLEHFHKIYRRMRAL
jgi:hypothetical protein